MLQMSFLVIFGRQVSPGFWPLVSKVQEFESMCRSARQFTATFIYYRSTLVDVHLNNFGKMLKKIKKNRKKKTFFNLPGLIFFSFWSHMNKK